MPTDLAPRIWRRGTLWRLGLTLLEGLLDKSDYTATEPHGTTVRVEKKLHYETKGAADGAVERDTDTGGVVTASKD